MKFLAALITSLVLTLLSGCKPEAATSSSESTSLGEIDRRILADPANASLYAERARYHEGLDSAVLAMNDWKRAIALDSTNASYHVALGDLFFKKVRLDDADKSFKRAIALDPEATEPRLKIAEMKLLLREYVGAMEMVNSALRIDQGLAHGYFLKGWIHMEAGDTTLAVSSFRTAVEQDPEYFDAYLQLGMLHATRHDPLAGQYYASALDLRPNSVEALYGMGMFAQESGRDSLALACYARIKEIDPGNALAWYNTGYVLLEHLQDPAAARMEFTEALRRWPAYPDAWYNHGLAHEREGRLDSAGMDYQRALTLDPGFTLAAEGLQRLQSKGLRITR